MESIKLVSVTDRALVVKEKRAVSHEKQRVDTAEGMDLDAYIKTRDGSLVKECAEERAFRFVFTPMLWSYRTDRIETLGDFALQVSLAFRACIHSVILRNGDTIVPAQTDTVLNQRVAQASWLDLVRDKCGGAMIHDIGAACLRLSTLPEDERPTSAS